MNRFILFVLGGAMSLFLSCLAYTPLHAALVLNLEPDNTGIPALSAPAALVTPPNYRFVITTGMTMPPGTVNYGRDISGYTVYEVYLETEGTTDVLERMFCAPGYPLSLSFPGGLYNNFWCTGATGSGVPSSELVPITELYQVDSYLTVGMSSVSLTNPGTVVSLLPEGHPLSLPFLSTANNIAAPVSVSLDGSNPVEWRVNALGNPVFKTAGALRRVKVMQFTTLGTAFSGQIQAEVHVNGDADRPLIVRSSFAGTSFGPTLLYGCTDATACNYEPLANTDDGGCTYPTSVLLDCNGDCLLDTDGDGICNALEVPGCTTVGSCNYNASATDDDGSCFGAVTWYEDLDGDGFGDPASSQVACSAPANHVAVAGDGCPSDAGKQAPGVCGCGAPEADADGDGVCDANEVPGCMNATACNYSGTATDDDGSCTYPATHYDCGGDCLVDTDGDGTCDPLEVDGCTDASACNFVAGATEDDGTCTYCGCSPFTGLSPASLTVERHAVDGIPGTVTYRLYVNVDDPEDAIASVYGSGVNQPWALNSTVTPGWYQHPAGVDFGWTLNDAWFPVAPDLAYDSWWTLGVDNVDDVSGFSLGFVTPPGSDFLSRFQAGQSLLVNDVVGSSMYMTLGCNRSLAPGAPGACNFNTPPFGGADGRVLIGQITSTGTLSGTVSVFILETGIYAFNQGSKVVFDFDGVGTFSYRGWSGAMASTNHACGCTDATSFNFDPFATLDDGSCVPEVTGCMDGAACNYDATANVASGACTYPTTWYQDLDGDGAGNPAVTLSNCTQPANYVSVAGDGCPGDASKTSAGACGCGVADTDADGDGVPDCNDLCTDVAACNFTANPTAACIYPAALRDCAGVCLADADGDNVCDAEEVAGCTNSTACNYNGSATNNDGSCTYATTWYADLDGDGAGDPAATVQNCSQPTNYVAAAGDGCPNDGAKTAPGPCGCGQVEADTDGDSVPDCLDLCTDVTACNFTANPTATCSYPAALRDCAGDCLADADSDDVCDAEEVPGCQDATACNYNGAATDDDGSCTYPTTWYADLDSDGLGDPAATQSACTAPLGYVATAGDACPADPTKSAPGACGCGTPDVDSDGDLVFDCVDLCSDVTACNYLAVPTAACTFAAPLRDCAGDCLADADSDDVCDAEEVPGCSDPDASNYNASATDPGPCLYAGCTDASACNFDCEALVDDGSCTYPALGLDCAGDCLTDGDGDGTCDLFEVHGCQDATACNFDALATDAGYCVYPAAGRNCAGTCLADADNDGVCDADEVDGCVDHLACNFAAAATEDDGSCLYAQPGYDCAGDCLVDADGDNVCDALEVLGCTDPTAWNYNSAATEDGGNCLATNPADAFNAGYNAGFAAGQTAGFASGQTAGYNSGFFDGYVLGYDDGEADGYDDGYAAGTSDGYDDGYADGSSDGYDDGYAAGSSDGYDDGYADGSSDGYDDGYAAGTSDGYDDGYADGSSDGYDDGYAAGSSDGYDDGYAAGTSDGYDDGYAAGTSDGYADGYAAGSSDGYDDGYAAGSSDGYDDGYAAGTSDGYDDGYAAGTSDGYDDGYAAGLAACNGAQFCGEGTVWHADLNACLVLPGCLGDLDGDAVRGTGDLLLLLSEFGNICEP